jgi:hypothetical protein
MRQPTFWQKKQPAIDPEDSSQADSGEVMVCEWQEAWGARLKGNM